MNTKYKIELSIYIKELMRQNNISKECIIENADVSWRTLERMVGIESDFFFMTIYRVIKTCGGSLGELEKRVEK